LLPERGKFAEIAEHFEIWWPRDVVGGDVYVVRPTAEGMLLGVMDCTGHGVPGAFMTVAASAAFDHAVAVCGGHSPGAILAEVNRYMRKRLNRSSEIGVDDGLEMGLVCWRPRARELVFAGGGLDLAVVDPAEARPPEAGETDPPGVTRIRGEKTGLGHRSSHPDHVFTDRPLQVTPGRAFYIASDGMLEQVGGERKLCFGWRRFRSVLAATAAHPLAEQREHLVAALQDWQGDCAQRDDITLIGVRPVAAPADTRDGGRNRGTGLGGVAQPDAADATNAAAAKP
jgi:serine phosphatase RsbU (regulator of sigma subunit)